MAESAPNVEVLNELLETSKEMRGFLIDIPQAVGLAVGEAMSKFLTTTTHHNTPSELVNNMRG